MIRQSFCDEGDEFQAAGCDHDFGHDLANLDRLDGALKLVPCAKRILLLKQLEYQGQYCPRPFFCQWALPRGYNSRSLARILERGRAGGNGLQRCERRLRVVQCDANHDKPIWIVRVQRGLVCPGVLVTFRLEDAPLGLDRFLDRRAVLLHQPDLAEELVRTSTQPARDILPRQR